MQRSELFSLTNTHPLSPFIPRSTIPVIPVVLMPALLRHPLQPEHMVMSSSPVLRTRCLTGQLDAYSFTKSYFQALSSSLPSPKKALCRPPSQHVRARARGNLGGETRRRICFLACNSPPLSLFPFLCLPLLCLPLLSSSSHSPNPITPTKTSLSLSLIPIPIPIPILILSIRNQIPNSKIQFTNLHIPNPAQTTLVPTTATFLGNTPNLDPERIIVPDCSRSCFIPE